MESRVEGSNHDTAQGFGGDVFTKHHNTVGLPFDACKIQVTGHWDQEPLC